MDEASAPVQIIHRGKFKSVDTQQGPRLKRRQVIEPVIGHTKTDHRMDRRWLGGSKCEALHAMPRAAGFNIRCLLRAIAANGLAALRRALSAWALHGPRIGTVLRRTLRVVAQRDGQLESRRYRLVPIVPAGCT